MRVQEVIRAQKSNVSMSNWGSGKMQKKMFPLSKAGRRAYSYGSAFEWRFVEFECNGRQFVARLLFCEGKSKATTHLAMRNGSDLTVLCCYEYHADHVDGWHIHTLCGDRNDIDTAPSGTLVHGPWIKRLPGAYSFHRRTEFYHDANGGLKAWLWQETMRFFNIDEKGTLV